MNKWLSRMDWILIMRLVMSASMIIVGIQSNDNVPIAFGTFFVIYSIIGAKYKIGCGYQACARPMRHTQNNSKVSAEIEYTEIK